MKGKWKTSSNSVGGERFYQVVRVIDTDQVEHSGNREYYGGLLESRVDAEAIAEKLNSLEKGEES